MAKCVPQAGKMRPASGQMRPASGEETEHFVNETPVCLNRETGAFSQFAISREPVH
jgi:hypothetical protein